MNQPSQPTPNGGSVQENLHNMSGGDQPKGSSTTGSGSTSTGTGSTMTGSIGTAGATGSTNAGSSAQGASGGSGSNNGGTGALLDQAKQWLGKANLGTSVGQPVRNAGTQVVNRFNQLSTTQKVVGGALLVLGGVALARSGGSKKRGSGGEEATLRELLLFVNDRIEGYRKAVEESEDNQLRGYYKQLVSQSQRFANELNDYLRERGGDRESGTTIKGKLYRRFMEASATLTGHSETGILGMNIHGEQWALKAYEDALDDHTLTGSLRQEVERQYAQSQRTYAELKRLLEQQQK